MKLPEVRFKYLLTISVIYLEMSKQAKIFNLKYEF